MALRNVVKEGDEVLRKRAREVTKFDDRLKQTMMDMVETMRAEFGVGLAAPQIGVMRRYFVAEPDPYAEEECVYFMINPVILEKSENLVVGQEGCLSVPGMIGDVLRHDYIKMEACDLNGEKHVYEFYDFDARVMQHEYDHLDGILYIDKASNIREATAEDYEDEEE